MFCAGESTGGKDSCQGDSGGLIFTYTNSGDAVTQVGVVSWGISCADARYPGVYAEIGAVRDWIDSEICRMSSDKPNSCDGGNCNDNFEPSNFKVVVDVDVLSDYFPHEISWKLSNSAGGVLGEITEFTSEDLETRYSPSIEVSKDEEYTFEISDSYGDGICCADGEGEYEVRVDGVVVGSGKVFGESESLTFIVPGENTEPPTDLPSSCEDTSNEI